MKVLICDPIAEQGVQKLKDAGHEVTVKTGLTPEDLAAFIEPYHAVIVRSATKVRKPAIEAGKNLKAIGRGGIGLDNIDVDVAKEKGIAVVNTPGASSISVAELAIAHMFGLARWVYDSTASMKEGKWEKKRFMGAELFGKTVGVIGTGGIGREVIKRCKALGMKVLTTKRRLNLIPDELKALDVPVLKLDEMLPQCDIITLHLPKASDAGYVIDKPQFDIMKDGVWLVNCSRGGVVSEAALIEALKSGKVAKAAIDVYAKEPTDNKELLQLPNVVLSPHIGASTREGQLRVGVEIADRIIEALG
ncbi:MAG: D-2-hydroxyacid dehydrogenase [Planctomycetota bacterium]